MSPVTFYFTIYKHNTENKVTKANIQKKRKSSLKQIVQTQKKYNTDIMYYWCAYVNDKEMKL